MEFARYMVTPKGKMPKEIQSYLNKIGFGEEEYKCYPEKVTPFDYNEFGSGSGRHHDGLLVSKQHIVGIEAKVDEPFDEPIQKKIYKAKYNKDQGENMKKRIVNSLKRIKPSFKEKDLDSVGHLMYQLISGSVGTIIEAQNNDIINAAFLIIEFESDDNKEKDFEKITRNQEAYDAFLKFLNLSDKLDEERYIQFDEGGGKLWIKKIKIRIHKEAYKYSEI